MCTLGMVIRTRFGTHTSSKPVTFINRWLSGHNRARNSDGQGFGLCAGHSSLVLDAHRFGLQMRQGATGAPLLGCYGVFHCPHSLEDLHQVFGGFAHATKTPQSPQHIEELHQVFDGFAIATITPPSPLKWIPDMITGSNPCVRPRGCLLPLKLPQSHAVDTTQELVFFRSSFPQNCPCWRPSQQYVFFLPTLPFGMPSKRSSLCFAGGC